MKKLTIIMLGAILSFAVSAQDKPKEKARHHEKQCSTEEAIENKCKKMSEKLLLDEATTAKFTPVYKAYLNDLKESRGDKHFKKDKEGKKQELSDSEIDAAMQKQFDNLRKVVDVREKYYGELRKFLTPRQAKTALQMGMKAHGKHHPNSNNAHKFNKRLQFGPGPQMPPKDKTGETKSE